MDTSLLRRLKFIEGFLMNIPLLLVWWLLSAMPLYFGVSLRLTFNFILILFLCSILFRRRLGNLLYVRIFPFMEPLWEYEQQKFISEKWIKWRRNRRYFNAFLIIATWIFIMLSPSPLPRQLDWNFITGSFVGFNIGMVIYVLREEFYY